MVGNTSHSPNALPAVGAREDDRFAAELRVLGPRILAARSYLAQPGSNPVLGGVYLDRLRAKRSGLLAVMRAIRIGARPDGVRGPDARPRDAD